MASVLSQYGNWLLLILGASLVVAMFWTVLAALKSRRAAYYGLRQEAIRQMRRRAVVATVLLFIFAALVFITNVQPAPLPATPVAVISTPTPTRTTIITPTTTLLPTSTVLPTSTPQGTVPAQLLLTPLPAAASPAPDAQLTFTLFASVLDSNNNPVDAGQVFPAGTRRVRIFFRAANVGNGVTWSILCYKNSRLVDSFAGPWQWGIRAQTARAFCGIDGSAGTYVVTAYLGLIKQFEATFEVITIAATNTPAP